MFLYLLICVVVVQAKLYINSGGTAYAVYRGNGAATLTTGSCSLLFSGYVYLEFKVTTHSSTGSYEVRFDGNVICSGSGVNTQATANSYITGVRFQVAGATLNTYFDDFYICDDSGSTCNTFLGPIRIVACRPTYTGAASGWVGSDGNSIDNYALVDEVISNGDVDFVSSSVSGTIDLYNIPDLSASALTVGGAQLRTVAKIDGAAQTISNVLSLPSGQFIGGPINPTSSYLYYYENLGTNPVSGTDWTVDDINNLQIGIVNLSSP